MRNFTYEWVACIFKTIPYILIVGGLFTLLTSLNLYGGLIPDVNHERLFFLVYFLTYVFIGIALSWSLFNEDTYQRHLEEDGTTRKEFKSRIFRSVIKMYPLYLLGLLVMTWILLIFAVVIIHIISKISIEDMIPEIRNRIYEIGYIIIFLFAISRKYFPPLAD